MVQINLLLKPGIAYFVEWVQSKDTLQYSLTLNTIVQQEFLDLIQNISKAHFVRP